MERSAAIDDLPDVNALTAELKTAERRGDQLGLIEALGESTTPDATAALLPWLEHTSSEVRAWTVRALARQASDDSIRALLGTVEGAPTDVARVAMYFIAKDPQRSMVPALAAAVRHRDVVVRRGAIRAVGGLRHRSVVEPLAIALSDSSDVNRRLAAKFLSRIEAPENVAALENARDELGWSKRWAIQKGSAPARATRTP